MMSVAQWAAGALVRAAVAEAMTGGEGIVPTIAPNSIIWFDQMGVLFTH